MSAGVAVEANPLFRDKPPEFFVGEGLLFAVAVRAAVFLLVLGLLRGSRFCAPFIAGFAVGNVLDVVNDVLVVARGVDIADVISVLLSR